MGSIDLIRSKQKGLKAGVTSAQAAQTYEEFIQSIEHNPDFALVGCIDARLPIASLGMKHGKAVVPRVPGAFTEPYEANSSMAASLAIAVNSGVTDIVVMGHTDCRAMNCCLKGKGHPDNAQLDDVLGYLEPLGTERERIMKLNVSDAEKARALEEAAVCASLDNIEKTYPAVRDAVKAGKVRLHGWVLDIDKALSAKPQPFLYELVDRDQKKFMLMADVPWQVKITGAADAKPAQTRQ